jgi:hypothetical protein
LYVQADIRGNTNVEPAPLRVTEAGGVELTAMVVVIPLVTTDVTPLVTTEVTPLVTTEVTPLWVITDVAVAPVPVTVEVIVLVPPETATYAPTAMITIMMTTTAAISVVAIALRSPNFFSERDLDIHNTKKDGFR